MTKRGKYILIGVVVFVIAFVFLSNRAAAQEQQQQSTTDQNHLSYWAQLGSALIGLFQNKQQQQSQQQTQQQSSSQQQTQQQSQQQQTTGQPDYLTTGRIDYPGPPQGSAPMMTVVTDINGMSWTMMPDGRWMSATGQFS